MEEIEEDVAFESLARDYVNCKRQERDAGDQRKSLGGVLLGLMSEMKIAKHRVDSDDDYANITVKTRENLTIDEARLKKAIGARAFNRLCVSVLSEDKIEAAIQLGELDANVVAGCTNEKKTQYLDVRFRSKKR